MVDLDLEHVDILGSTMLLSPTEPGIHDDLIRNRIREPYTTMAYRNALLSRSWHADGPLTVVDVGANIGYYALQPCALFDDVRVIAIEPEPVNAAILREAVEVNGYDDRIQVFEAGLGATETTETLYTSELSNWHSMSEEKRDRFGNEGAVEIDVAPIERFVNPAAVDAIRMDVEGYDAEALRGLEPVSEAAEREVLCNIEVHPTLMDEGDNAYVRESLAPHVHRLYSVAQGDKQAFVTSVAEALDYNWMELVFDWSESDT